MNYIIDLAQIRDKHKVTVNMILTPEQCVELAKRCDILQVKDLTAKITLTEGNRPDLFRIQGNVAANVVQACGVSFTPVNEKVNEVFDETLTTDPAALDAPEETDDSVEQPVDLIENEKIDLDDIVAQWLAVSLNPYPRSDAPEFEHIEQKENESGEKTHTPFSVLEKLKK